MNAADFYCPQTAAAKYSRILAAMFSRWQKAKRKASRRPVFILWRGRYFSFEEGAELIAVWRNAKEKNGYTLIRRPGFAVADFPKSHLSAALAERPELAKRTNAVWLKF